MYEELIKKLRTESLDSRKASLSIMDLCMDAAAAIEALTSAVEAARAGRDAAAQDLADVIGEIESIRQRYEIGNDVADEALSYLCGRYCAASGKMCYKEGLAFRCDNFRWRGKVREGE